MTIDNLINWLQEAEDNNTWLVSTQSVKRHLEKIKETEQLTLTDVVKSLPTDEEIYSEGCSYVRKIEQPNRQPLITLRRTFKAGAEFVKKQLYN